MRPYKSEGTLNTIESSTNVHINLVACIVKGMLKIEVMIMIMISFNVLLNA